MATNALAILTLGGLFPTMGLKESLGMPCISCDRLSATRERFSGVSRLAAVCHFKSYKNIFTAELSDKEVIAKQARKQFCEEIAFCKQDQDVSLAKAMLLISAEDEAFLSINKEKDNLAVQKEGREHVKGRTVNDAKCLEVFPLAGNTISTWMAKFDSLSKEVATMLAMEENCHHPIRVLKAVNKILFEVQGFKTTIFTLDPRKCYLHHVMNLGSGSAVMLGIVYMDICQRLGIKMVGAAVGENFIIWPLLQNIQDIFEASTEGESWFSVVNHTANKYMYTFDSGVEGLVYGPSSGPNTPLKIASNRDIVEITLRNLKVSHHCKGSLLEKSL